MGAVLLASHPICKKTFELALSSFVPIFTRGVNLKEPHPFKITVELASISTKSQNNTPRKSVSLKEVKITPPCATFISY